MSEAACLSTGSSIPWKQTLQQLVLRDGKFQPRPVSDEVRPEFIDGIVVRLDEVW